MNVAPAIAREARALWGGGRGPSLLLIAIPWGVLVGARMAFPVLLPDIQTTYELSLTAAGLLISLLWLGGAVGQFPSGVLADRYSEHRLMAAATVVVAIAITLIVTAPVALVLFVASGLWGVGHSLYPIARITILTDLYPDRIGSALGVTMATGDIGQTILPPVAGVLAGVLAWQVGLGFVVVPLVVSGVLLWLLLPDPSPATSPADSLSFEKLWHIVDHVREPVMLSVALVLFFYSLIWQSFTAFYPTYLISAKGLPPATAATLFGLFFGIGVVVKPLSGVVYDRIGLRWSLAIALTGPVVGFVLLPVVTTTGALVIITVLVSTMLGSGAITQSFLADMFPREMRGSGLGMIRGTVFTIGSTGPVFFGALADAGYFDEGYLLLAGISVLLILLTFKMPAV